MSANQDTQADEPWDRERIKFALRQEGYSLSRLDREHGQCRGYFSQALIQPMRKAEKIISDILGVKASTLWPARYGSDGRPHQGRFLPDAKLPANGAARQPSRKASS